MVPDTWADKKHLSQAGFAYLDRPIGNDGAIGKGAPHPGDRGRDDGGLVDSDGRAVGIHHDRHKRRVSQLAMVGLWVYASDSYRPGVSQ
jgi:hypothetical protein